MSEEMEFDDDQMLAAEYALGLLTGDELASARRRLSEEPGFAASVARWEIELAELVAEVEPVAVPAAVKSALEERLHGASPAPLSSRMRAALSFWRGVSAVAVFLAAILGWLWLSAPAPDGLRAAEIASDDGAFRYLAVLDEAEGVLQVTRISGEAPAGRVLQVWAHGDDQPAISVGLFGDGETARLVLPDNLRGIEGTFTMGISEEPPGGSQQDGPSGEVLGQGEIRGL